MSSIVVGLDLSLTSSGMCAIPESWGLDWSRCEGRVSGYSVKDSAPELERVKRLVRIRGEVLDFCAAHKPESVWILGYAFSKMQSRAHAAGELGGVVKVALLDAGYRVEVVVESRARTLLGKAPGTRPKAGEPKPMPAKVWATERLMAAGAPPRWPQDVLDAFVAANWGLSERGATALIMRDQAQLFRETGT